MAFGFCGAFGVEGFSSHTAAGTSQRPRSTRVQFLHGLREFRGLGALGGEGGRQGGRWGSRYVVR